MQVKIIDVATGKVPLPTQQIAPANNILHTLFSSCRIWLGETLITMAPDKYAHRSYFIDLLSFDSMAKYSWLESQGWYQDVFGSTLANQTSHNSGFSNRRGRFLIDPKVPTSKFAEDGAIFMGRLHTDFVAAKCGLIPGLGMRIVLGYSPSSFVLQKTKTDTATYKILIENATLFCPVATLSADVFRRLEHKLKTEDAKLFLERSEMTNKIIPKGQNIFVDQLFSGAPLPSRIVIGFVATTNFLGTETTNPYFFQRKFRKPTPPPPPPPGPGAVPSTSSWIPSRARTRASATAEDEFEEIVAGDDDDYVFIEKVSVTLNGEQIDGLEEGVATLISDTPNFLRLHLLLGFLTSTTGNNLTFSEFHNGFFFLVYDLTTSSNAAAEYVIPAIRQGNLQIQVTFSGPLPFELTMLIFAEYPTLIKISQTRQIRISY